MLKVHQLDKQTVSVKSEPASWEVNADSSWQECLEEKCILPQVVDGNIFNTMELREREWSLTSVKT